MRNKKTSLEKRTIFIDCSYIAHQALFTLGDLFHNGRPSGVVFGFLMRLITTGSKFKSNDFVFCWDSKHSLRKRIQHDYKAGRRKDLTEEEIKKYRIFYQELDRLREHILPTIGWNNQFMQHGYEADDVIAANIKPNAVVVSADEDLFQCLSVDGVSIWNTNKNLEITASDFTKRFNISPEEWVFVKCIAGCSSDNVKGIKGVGEKTAIKWLRDELKKESKIFLKIEKQKSEMISKNFDLVSLPFPGCWSLPIKKDEALSIDGLLEIASEYGFKSFTDGKHFSRWDRFLKGVFTDEPIVSKKVTHSNSEKRKARRVKRAKS